MSMIAQGDEQDNDFSIAYHKGKQAGIKEVVDYLDSVFINSNCITLADIKPKLKEWGL